MFNPVKEGENTVKQNGMRLTLMNSAIKVVANAGLDKTTTKAIATDANLNEVYIYRTFEDKDDLLMSTFNSLDDELRSCILTNLLDMEQREIKGEESCWVFLENIWEHILSDYDKCIYFIRFYYSRFLDSYANSVRKKKYSEVIEKMQPAFIEGTDVWTTLNYILGVMFSFAIKIIRGEDSEGNLTAEYVFRLIYAALQPQMSWTQKKSA